MVDQTNLNGQALTELLDKETEWHKACIFNQDCEIIAEKNCANVPKSELQELLKSYDNRDYTVGRGFTLQSLDYDVHRFHPPLIYGRRGNADEGEGISLAIGTAKNGQKVYLIIAYLLPIVSARAVPQQINFYNNNIGSLDQFQQPQTN